MTRPIRILPLARRSLFSLFSLFSWLLLGGLQEARAASFSVSPTTVQLGPSTQSQMLVLRNPGTEGIRLKVDGFAWKQGSQGEMQLAPTQDILFFPSMLTIPPGGTAKVRVGLATAADVVEHSYRIFIEELAPNASVQGNTAGVRVLTRMAIPIFTLAGTPSPRPQIAGMAVRGTKLSFELQNTGNAHILASAVRTRVFDGEGKTLFERKLDGWYVLSGGVRRFDLDLPKEACKGAQIAVEAETDKGVVSATLQDAKARCSP